VHYVRFAVSASARTAIGNPAADARVVVDHANYRAESVLSPATRRALLDDLAG
jgi:hypothetical protein